MECLIIITSHEPFYYIKKADVSTALQQYSTVV